MLAGCCPCGRAQRNNVERRVPSDCQRTASMAREYLRSHGFTEADVDGHLRSTQAILDANGKSVSTSRIRTRLSTPKVPFFIWSTPLKAQVGVSTRADGSGCVVGLTITFHSLHRMVAAIIPVNEALVLGSNGALETEYLDAILASLPPS
uniref:Uncharacterized protein n=1 Tax=Solibacter usitatus (strain Ellin6076) TaxID=234267 RepID=Q01Y03_SOLUE